MKLVIALHNEKHPYWSFPEHRVDELRREFPELRIVFVKAADDLAREIVDADIAYLYRITLELFNAARQLRWVHIPSAGVDQLLIPEVLASNIVITNSSGGNSIAVAEQVIGYMLAFTRRLVDAVLYQKEKVWSSGLIWSSEPPLEELYGKTLGIVGLGSIGKEVARRAGAFGMRVLATRKDVSKGGEHIDLLLPADKPHDLLEASDFVLLSLPLTKLGGQVLGAEELRRMKKTAFLINISRGRLVDEEALIKALGDKQLAGAALDVFRKEPLSPESPLWNMPNVIITPHNAGLSVRLWDHLIELFKENVKKFLRGEPLRNVVDKQLGY